MHASESGMKKLCYAGALCGAGLFMAGSGLAATITVPGNQPTIAAAITAAAAGDTILVSPGTYTESITINKSLILLSTANNATITFNSAGSAIITVAADGVQIGAPGQGFTIDQQDSGTDAIIVQGDKVKSGGFTIQNCTIKGNQSPNGIYVYPNIEGGTCTIQNNSFAHRGAATYSFGDAIAFDYVTYGAPLSEDIAAHTATINVLGNSTAANAADVVNDTAVWFGGNIFNSTVNINGNTLGGTAAAGYGVYVDESVHDFSTLTTNNNTLTSFDYGYYVNYYVESNSSWTVSGGSVTDFRDYGLYVDYVEYNAALTVQNVTFDGDAANAADGMDFYLYDHATVLVDGCTIKDIDSYGIYADDVEEGSTLTITNNTINFIDTGSSAYGIYTYTEYGSSVVVRNNTITGFDYCGLYESYPEYGCTYTVDGNTFTASASGADYGIYIDDIYYGTNVFVTNNTVSNVDYAGLYIDYVEYGSNLTVTGNTITALTTSGADYGFYLYEVDYYSYATVTGNTFTGYNYVAFENDYVGYWGGLVFSNNTATAFATGADYGLYIYEQYEGAKVTIDNNHISGYGNSGGTDYGLYHYEAYDGTVFNFTNNVLSANVSFSTYGIYSDDGFEDGVIAALNGNTISGFTDTGIYVNYHAYDGSTCTINNNTITAAATGAGYGIDAEYVEYGSHGEINGNTITGFNEAGIFTYDSYEGCSLEIKNNNLTAGTTIGSDIYGIESDDYIDYGSSLVISGNTISNLNKTTNEVYGIYFYEVEDGSTAQILNNTISAVAGGTGDGYGIYCDYLAYYGSELDISGNILSGFSYCGMYLNDSLYSGSTVKISNNQIWGGEYGVYHESSYQIYDGSIMWVFGNKIADFTSEGWTSQYVGNYVFGASHLTFEQNRFNGGAGATYGIQILGDASGAGEVELLNNCFTSVTTAFEINNIKDTAFVNASGNNFAGATTAIHNVAGDAAHAITADGNFFGAATNSGEVTVTNSLATAANADGDGDGVDDCDDECPGTADGAAVDATGCSCAQLHPFDDADGDGTIDCLDGCPNDANKTAPGQCGCGNADTDTDGDGVANCVDGCPNDPNKSNPGQCGCGNADTDTDGDGVADCVDGCPNDATKSSAGQCGCGHADTDSDGDGVADCVDGCPSDPAKSSPGTCGCGTADTDSDGDGIPDCLDNCPNVANTSQLDSNGNGVGDACDGAKTCGAGLCGAGMTTLMPLLLVTLLGLKRNRK